MKTLAPWMDAMYRKEPSGQQEFSDFYLPFAGQLNMKNRWIQLANLIPWKEFEEAYAQQFAESGQGAPAKPFRIALGSLLIKEKLGLTDEETVEHIRETPYLQYLIGMEAFRDEPPFDPSMMVHFRRRITIEMLQKINDWIHEEQVKKNVRAIHRLKRRKVLR